MRKMGKAINKTKLVSNGEILKGIWRQAGRQEGGKQEEARGYGRKVKKEEEEEDK